MPELSRLRRDIMGELRSNGFAARDDSNLVAVAVGHIRLAELLFFCALLTLVVWCLDRFASLPIWASVPLGFMIAFFVPAMAVYLPLSLWERLRQRRSRLKDSRD